ncbi:MAG: hypothetical protein KDD22_04475 [Bdellovibrionales bacterium]|nr:hypothetical protein [Bdellovibrionales bacterium]
MIKNLWNVFSISFWFASAVTILVSLSSPMGFTQESENPQRGFPVSITLDSEPVGIANSPAELVNLYTQLIEDLRNKDGTSTNLSIGGQHFNLDLPLVGEGKLGIVFHLSGTSLLIKLPKGESRFFNVLLGEDSAAQTWTEKAYESGRFSVGKTLMTHPLGLYSIKKQVLGETLGEFFFRYRVLKLNSEGKAYINEHALNDLQSSPSFLKVKSAILEVIRIIQAHPEIGLSLSPHNIIVSYKNEMNSEVTEVSLIDVGLSPRAGQRYHSMTNFREYLEEAVLSVNKDIALSRTHLSITTFDEAQTNFDFLIGENLMGSKIRISGLTSKTYEIIRAALAKVLEKHQLHLSGGFFYGSRVMPRSIVNKRSSANLPVLDDGVDKSYVRNSGLTTISDLEMIVVIDNAQDSSVEYLRQLKAELLALVEPQMRLFPVGIRFINLHEKNKSHISAQASAQEFMTSRGYELSKHQFISLAKIEESYRQLFKTGTSCAQLLEKKSESQ